MAAHFKKLTFNDNYWDGFDDSRPHSMSQMIPFKKVRQIGVITEAEPCLLRIKHPAIAKIFGWTDRLSLDRNHQYDVVVYGEGAGNTELILENVQGKPIASI